MPLAAELKFFGAQPLGSQSIPNSSLAFMPALSVKANPTNAAASPQDIVGVANQFLQVASGGATLGWVTMSGDATLASGVITVSAAAITFAKIQNIAGLSVFGNAGTAAGAGGNITATASQFLGVNSGGTALAFATMSGDASLSGPAITVTPNDRSTVLGFLQTASQAAINPGPAFWNPLFFGNAGTGRVHRFNRVKMGIACLSSSDTGPMTTTDWLEVIGAGFSSQNVLTSISPIAGAGVVGANRTSDFQTWDGLGPANHSGGPGALTGWALNDDITGGNPIACATLCNSLVGVPVSATVTITIASPAVVTWTAHGRPIGAEIIFSTTGALPTGITAGTAYYIIAAGFGANSFEISATQASGGTGTPVNTSGTQSGTQTATNSPARLGITVSNQMDCSNGGAVTDVTPFTGMAAGTQTPCLYTAGTTAVYNIHNVSVGCAWGPGTTAKFRKGAVFFNNALDTTVGAGTNGVAIEFARQQSIRWLNSTPTTDAEIWGASGGIAMSAAGAATTPLSAAGFFFLTLNNSSGSGLSLQQGGVEIGRAIVASNTFQLIAEPSNAQLQLLVNAGTVTGLAVYPSGGVFIGNTGTSDPGVNNFTVQGVVRINQTPTAVVGAGPIPIGSASTINTRISINMNGTTYWIPATTTAF